MLGYGFPFAERQAFDGQPQPHPSTTPRQPRHAPCSPGNPTEMATDPCQAPRSKTQAPTEHRESLRFAVLANASQLLDLARNDRESRRKPTMQGQGWL
ncbi:hypothetical protein BCR44DRAFT_1428471 [Catenaria anguillulae PL171]|uniref:Uncharacterized protein n=1 Tax=Catenaria anguillulae PL171 TaxID=765915 RepID=A0A1Y2HXT6_9FUNG|nr:hypothetical protein BCR44DRAFT_1428471 [Catenaria anguillulae PL171]